MVASSQPFCKHICSSTHVCTGKEAQQSSCSSLYTYDYDYAPLATGVYTCRGTSSATIATFGLAPGVGPMVMEGKSGEDAPVEEADVYS